MRSLVAVSLLVLAACTASGPIFSPSAQPKNDQALIYLYRVKTPYGAWVPMKVEVNGEDVGILPNDSYTSLYVAPGALKLSATRWQDFTYPESKRVSVTGNVGGGETYYLRISQDQSGNVYTTRLERVSQEVAEPDLKVLKRAEPAK